MDETVTGANVRHQHHKSSASARFLCVPQSSSHSMSTWRQKREMEQLRARDPAAYDRHVIPTEPILGRPVFAAAIGP